MSKRSIQQWGTNVLENATGKNSAYEGSGQKRFRPIALNRLYKIRKSILKP